MLAAQARKGPGHGQAMVAVGFELQSFGQLKTGLLKQVKDPVALKMMRAIKSALDPKGILNPGKLLG